MLEPSERSRVVRIEKQEPVLVPREGEIRAFRVETPGRAADAVQGVVVDDRRVVPALAIGAREPARVVAEAVPLLSGALEYAERGFLAGGLGRNRAFLKGLVEGGALGLSIAAAVPTTLADLLFDSETSGGLLFSVAPEYAPEVATRFAGRGEAVWEIGEVISEVAIHIV